MPRKAANRPGRPGGKSGLPPEIPGEPFSLIGTLRRCRQALSVKDVATLLQIEVQTVYAWRDKGLLPMIDTGTDLVRFDPKAWAEMLEKRNPHLVQSARRSQQAAAAAA